MSVSGLPAFLISVKNMNLLSSSIYKHLKTYLIKHKQSLQGLKLRKYFRGQVGPYQINFGSPHLVFVVPTAGGPGALG
jgi:hypothetical protein